MKIPQELPCPISTNLAVKNNYAFGGRSMSVLLARP